MNSPQKTIGVIGGASWESTVVYYQLINRFIRERLGGLHSAKMLLYSVNYDPIVRLEQQGKWNEVGEQIAAAAKILQEGGARFLILCCNTLHKVTSAIEQAIDIPFLHIADPAGKMLASEGFRKIGLLGTQFTMEDGFYATRLQERFGLETLIPSTTERKRMDQIIYDELCQGKVVPASKHEVLRMIQSLQSLGAEAVLFGCTELGMLLDPNESSIPAYDTTLLHAQEAASLSLGLT